jgi:excisionase family DNA binding protein
MRNEKLRMQKLTLSVPEAARLLGVSRMTAYTAIRDGTIPSLKLGRRVLVPRAALERLLDPIGLSEARDRAGE